MSRIEAEFSVMTLNLRFGLARDGENSWDHRKEAVHQLLENYPSDFMGVQEVNHFQARFLEENLKDHRHIGWHNKHLPWWQSNMIFYHKSWVCQGFRHFFLSHTPDWLSKLPGSMWPRQCVVGWFQKGHQNLLMANTHFDFAPLVQTKSAGLVSGFLSGFWPGMDTVVTGDFNADEGSGPYKTFAAHGFKEVFKGRGPGTFHDFTGESKGRHIDWILYRGNLVPDRPLVIQRPPGGRFPSDHFPVRSGFFSET